jgi:hypothetical protein
MHERDSLEELRKAINAFSLFEPESTPDFWSEMDATNRLADWLYDSGFRLPKGSR